MMHKNSCCNSCNSCNSCGDSCCGGGVGAPVMAPKAGEPIAPPKKMPGSGTGNVEPPREVRIITPPAASPATTPALEVAPTAVPGLDADNRNPF